MPRFIEGVSAIPEGYQPRWQSPQFPQQSIMILIITTKNRNTKKRNLLIITKTNTIFTLLTKVEDSLPGSAICGTLP